MKWLASALLSLLAFSPAVLASDIHTVEWNSWKQFFGKNYTSEVTEAERFTIWSQNLKYINNFNARSTGVVLAMNHFGDLTNEEFRKLYNNFVAPPRTSESTFQLNDNVALPDSVDWRQQNAVTQVKNQGQCGSCWSFSATGSMEGAHAINTGNLVSLSEQNLIDCSTAQGNQGCNGGSMDSAFQYVISNGGIDTETSYPYTASQGYCNYNAANSAATISGFQDLPSGNEATLQQAVATAGPVSVAIDASQNSFQFYSSGIYSDPACSSTNLDHGVLAVSYGSYGSSQDYWIVKNSWGTTWGQAGYIYMARNDNNMCGIATQASYPTV